MYNEFEKWIETIFNQELPGKIKAINFNLYGENNNSWSLEMVGTENFDLYEEDWACDEIFDTRDNPLRWEEQAAWEDILEEISGILLTYMEKGQYADKIKTYQGVGVGFVDGDIKLIYVKQ
jgi:shikimate kinase